MHSPLHFLRMLAAAVFAAVCLTACFDKTLSDYNYAMEDGKIMAYDGLMPYDGKIWTDDGASALLTFSDGILESIEYFSAEGKRYCVLDAAGQQATFYNGAGAELQRGAFRHLYRDQYREWRRLNEEIWEVFKESSM